MKKILLLLLIFIYINVNGQDYPIKLSPTGNSRTLSTINGGVKITNLIFGQYTDTSAANAGYVKNYNMAIISTLPNKIWMRVKPPGKWQEIGTGSLLKDTLFIDTTCLIVEYDSINNTQTLSVKPSCQGSGGIVDTPGIAPVLRAGNSFLSNHPNNGILLGLDFNTYSQMSGNQFPSFKVNAFSKSAQFDQDGIHLQDGRSLLFPQGLAANKTFLTTVRLNGTDYSANSAGLADLGAVSGGGADGNFATQNSVNNGSGDITHSMSFNNLFIDSTNWFEIVRKSLLTTEIDVTTTGGMVTGNLSNGSQEVNVATPYFTQEASLKIRVTYTDEDNGSITVDTTFFIPLFFTDGSTNSSYLGTFTVPQSTSNWNLVSIFLSVNSQKVIAPINSGVYGALNKVVYSDNDTLKTMQLPDPIYVGGSGISVSGNTINNTHSAGIGLKLSSGIFSVNDHVTTSSNNFAFYQSKLGAFWVGRDFAGIWSDATVGDNSFAAAGGYASNTNSIGLFNARATGNSSFAYGSYSTSFATGTCAIAFGSRLKSREFAGTVLGFANDTTDIPNPDENYTLTRRVFQIGNGTSSVASNALTILQNGNIGIGNTSETLAPTERLVVDGTVLSKYKELSADPTATELPAGYTGVFRNSTSGNTYLWANVGGTLIKVQLQ